MKLLLDTHSFLWFVEDDPHMPDHVKDLIEDEQHEKYFSIASAWELAIKVGLGKLTLSLPLEIYLPDSLQRNGIGLLPITLNHAIHVASLPLHHKDPFDRLLVTQSLLDAMPIISVDAILDSYGVTRLW